MIFSTLVVSALLAASTLVQASPMEPRQKKDFESDWIDTLKKKGLTKAAQSYSDAFSGQDGGDVVNVLNNGETTTVLVPNDDAFDSDHSSIVSDGLKYNTINGSPDNGFKGDSSVSRRTPNQNHLKGTTNYPSIGLGGSGSKRWNNDNNNQSIFINQFVIDGRKRWEPALFVEGPVGSSKVMDRFTYKKLIVLIIDSFTTIPGKVSDLLCKSLINSTPNGFTKFGGSLQKVDLLDTVDYNKRITIFAPTDDAFNKINTDDWSNDDLSTVIKNHFSFGKVIYSALFPTTSQVTAESGKEIQFVPGGGATYVQCGSSKAQVLRSDVLSQNGVLHVIDSVLKFATLGSELVPSLQSHWQPNETLLEGWWGTNRLPNIFRPRAPPCQPKSLGRGDDFQLSASLFDYTVLGAWNTSASSSAAGFQSQTRAAYQGQSFSDCFVNSTRWDYDFAEPAQTVTVTVTCPGYPEYPIYMWLETKAMFSLELKRDFVGQRYGPSAALLRLTGMNPSDYQKLTLSAIDVISTDSFTIIHQNPLRRPLLGLSVSFDVDNATAVLSPVTSTLTYLNGTTTRWADEATIYWVSITNLVHVINHAVNLDLGSQLSPNFFRNASILSQYIKPNLAPPDVNPADWLGNDTQPFYYDGLPSQYQTWAQALLNQYPVTLGNLANLPSDSAMATTYLCPMYRAKSLGPLLTSVFVGTATMAMSAWAAWMFFTAFLAKRLVAPRIQCYCADCQKRQEKEREDLEADVGNSSKPGMIVKFVTLDGIGGPAKFASDMEYEKKADIYSEKHEEAQLLLGGDTSPTSAKDLPHGKRSSYSSRSTTGEGWN